MQVRYALTAEPPPPRKLLVRMEMRVHVHVRGSKVLDEGNDASRAPGTKDGTERE